MRSEQYIMRGFKILAERLQPWTLMGLTVHNRITPAIMAQQLLHLHGVWFEEGFDSTLFQDRLLLLKEKIQQHIPQSEQQAYLSELEKGQQRFEKSSIWLNKLEPQLNTLYEAQSSALKANNYSAKALQYDLVEIFYDSLHELRAIPPIVDTYFQKLKQLLGENLNSYQVAAYERALTKLFLALKQDQEDFNQAGDLQFRPVLSIPVEDVSPQKPTSTNASQTWVSLLPVLSKLAIPIGIEIVSKLVSSRVGVTAMTIPLDANYPVLEGPEVLLISESGSHRDPEAVMLSPSGNTLVGAIVDGFGFLHLAVHEYLNPSYLAQR